MERRSNVAWPVIGKIGHEHHEHAINLESEVRNVLSFFAPESGDVSRAGKSIPYHVAYQLLRSMLVYLNVELNTGIDYHHGELPDLANTLRVTRTHDGPNSQLRVLDGPNLDADGQPGRTVGTLKTTKEAAREKKRRDTGRRVQRLRERVKQRKLRKSVSVPATATMYRVEQARSLPSMKAGHIVFACVCLVVLHRLS